MRSLSNGMRIMMSNGCGRRGVNISSHVDGAVCDQVERENQTVSRIVSFD